MRFGLYVVLLCAVGYFALRAAAALGHVNPFFYLRCRALPLVAGSLGLLLQTISLVARSSGIQQKILSRIPLMAALLFTAFFSSYADWFFGVAITAAVLFLSAAVGKARYQKRALVKFALFLGLAGALSLAGDFRAFVAGQLLLFPALFYFFVFEHAVGVAALVDDRTPPSGGPA
jgi:hypothetical protein